MKLSPQIYHLPVTLPIWAKYVAIDRFGALVAFENRPNWAAVNDGQWHARGRHKDIMQWNSQSFRGWKKSLVCLDPAGHYNEGGTR